MYIEFAEAICYYTLIPFALGKRSCPFREVCSQDMKLLMEKDACTFVVYQNPAAQIYYSIVYLVEYVLFGTLPSQELNFLPPQIVVRENIDYYLEGDNKFIFVN